jgi:hypothetical protein
MHVALRIATSALLAASLSACQQRAQPVASVGFNTMAQQGLETWAIDGTSSRIDATYYLALPQGLQYTIEVPVESVPESESAALEMAWPYMRYAYEHKLYLRTHIARDGSDVEATRIGVALVKHIGIENRGNRVAMSITDIQARINNGSRGGA